MIKENKITEITEQDLLALEKELSKTKKPLAIQEMTKTMVYKKTSSQLSQEVKRYDPECNYEVGDFILKEYDEPLTVSSKGVEHFKGAVVLKVTKKIPYPSFKYEMLEVDFTGGGVFRKYMDYMKKAKTQVLLPSNFEGKAKTHEIIEKKEDPRLSDLPMTDKDIKTLERNLRTALSKSRKFFNWNEYWQLAENNIKIEDKKIEDMEKRLTETKASAEISELVTQLFSFSSSDELFDLSCMSLNFTLEKKFKKDFILVSPYGWGKWHLKTIINSFPQELPLSAPMAKLPEFVEKEKEPPVLKECFPLKIYLTWREILSGGIKIPIALNKEFSNSREYIFHDVEAGTDYTVYYYPSSCFFLGLKGFYEANNVPQGASLTLEKKEHNHLNFWLKKSKKKLTTMKMTYDPKEDRFDLSSEEVFTFALPNKIIHLERETLNKLLFYYQQRDNLNLHEFLILIFKKFGAEGEKFSLHYLRAYHLVDILKQTIQEDVERTLLSTPEFSPSEKKKGIFFYKEKIKVEEEIVPEEVPEIPLEVPAEERLEEALPSALEMPEIRGEEAELEARVEPQRPAIEEEVTRRPPKKEKLPKKKRQIMEAEREKRAVKGAKKIIEEKIELEESEQEAYFAAKTKEKEEEKKEEALPKKEEAKPLVSKEPVFGIFAEKLKTALEKKKKEKK